MDVLSADWVLPISGPPIENGAVAIEGGRIAAVGTASELGRGTHYEGAAILPGFVNCHSHLEYAVYAGFGDGTLDFAEWIGIHVQRKQRLAFDDVVDIARLGAAECLASGITTVGDCSFSGAAALGCHDARAARRSSTSRSSAATRSSHASTSSRCKAVAGPACRSSSSPASRRTRRTPSPRRSTRCARRLGVPVATHLSESASELAYLHDGSGPWESFRELLVPPAGTTGSADARRHRSAHARTWSPPTASWSSRTRSSCSRATASASRTARARTRCSAAASPRSASCSTAGVTVGLGTDSPASAPSFDMFDELRAAVSFARARERAPGRPLLQRRRSSSRRLGSARALGLDGEVGTLEAGKAADIVVVGLEGSTVLPWEDPADGGRARRFAATGY